MAPLATSPEDLKARIRSFWDRAPCGSAHSNAAEGSREWFAEIESKRLELEPFISDYARFSDAAGRDVLEIGVGLGTDFLRYARAGARVTGVDLTPHSVDLVQKRLRLEELPGSVCVADAERLPFADSSFDLVYSWGVLHHTPDTESAVREAIRVLRPGGHACIMLYGRHSWLAYALWLRHALAKGHPRTSLASVLSDHMESEGTKGYTVRELRSLFNGLENVSVCHRGTPYDRKVAGPIADLTGNWLGWFVVTEGTKPQPMVV